MNVDELEPHLSLLLRLSQRFPNLSFLFLKKKTKRFLLLSLLGEQTVTIGLTGVLLFTCSFWIYCKSRYKLSKKGLKHVKKPNPVKKTNPPKHTQRYHWSLKRNLHCHPTCSVIS